MMRHFSNQTEKLVNTAFICWLAFVSSQVHAMDLVTFGKACLKQENYLNRLKQKIDEADFARDTSKGLNNGAKANLRAYNRQLGELESELVECQKINPNSVYCHEVRIHYNRLTELADRAEDRLESNLEKRDDHSPQNLFFRQQRYDNVYDQFVAMCRDSDAHYQLLQDPNAYQQVCATSRNKASITCSLF